MSISNNQCIFCGFRGKLTKEHIWPEWMRQYLPRTLRYNYHWVMRNGAGPVRGKLHRPGDPHSQTLRVVCRECNNGWMSSLQEAAKPILLPLLGDHWSSISEADQKTLGAWASMFVSVAEMGDPPTATIPPEHRRFIKNSGLTPPDWVIWIGRSDPEGEHPAFCNHHGIKLLSCSTDRLPIAINMQFTGFTVGKLFVQTTMVTPNIDEEQFVVHYEQFAKQYDLRTIVPFVGAISSAPTASHGLGAREAISNNGPQCFGIETYGIGPDHSNF